ncbi:Small GTPase superfamily, Rab type domain-containing protein [Rozella allomycis CSF55]|uniref:Small GTPase superfamily, Rab type domain-containing protein n=1 Tax=Rozella allomycis (strain CSF55) TaxID=988480 RepID=A0A075AX78_ROZAC|nr:Small GTPase superfamily, Rab type domain-containing protein [Rozella allomycis CSF55]|eukprot:EPZ33114.1 Small GTPase superfamily, Rab type domain-containing protein [Rozella allomycis CSF55]
MLAGEIDNTSSSQPQLSTLATSENKKIVVVGSGGSGKSSIVTRLINNSFNEEYQQTIGADMFVKQISNSSKKHTLQIWSCGGHERYRSLYEQFYEDCDCVLVVFDMTNEASFQDALFWHNEIRRCIPEALSYLIGNRIDESDKVKINIEDAAKQAKTWNMTFKPVSAKTGQGISDLFAEISDAIP